MRTTRTAAKALLAVLLTGAGMECGVRLSGYADRYVSGPVYAPGAPPEAIPYVHRAGLRNALGYSRTRFDTDALGLRSGTTGERLLAKAAGETRIAVLGDSVTFGQGVTTPETFCAVLERRLTERQRDRRFRVLNFGVSGYSVREMFETLRLRVPEVEPDLVVLGVIFSDFELHRCGRVDRWGYLHNRKVASFEHPDALRYLLLRQVHLTYLMRDIALRWGFGGQPAEASPEAVPGTVPSSYAYIREAARLAEQRGTPFLVALLPSAQYDGSEMEGVRRRLAEDGIVFADFSRLRAQFSLKDYSVTRRDSHPSPAVHRVIGDGLAEPVERARSPRSLPAVTGSAATIR